MFLKYLVSLLLVCGMQLRADIEKSEVLQQCLETYWGVDRHSAAFLVNRFGPLLENPHHQGIIDDFIEKSQRIEIDFSRHRTLQPLPPEDGVLCAPEQHLVVFENPYVRILWGSTEPGEREPFHVHAWKSLFVVIQPTSYLLEYPNGTSEEWQGNVGVFELPANERYACTNSGDTADEILRFEIKEPL